MFQVLVDLLGTLEGAVVFSLGVLIVAGVSFVAGMISAQEK